MRKRLNSICSFNNLLLVVYIILGLAVCKKYYEYQINPDGIKYISIAQKYLRGEIHDAVNGYWGPLFSWLLVPFLMMGLHPLFAVKALNIFISAVAMIGIRLLLKRFYISGTFLKYIQVMSIPLFMYMAVRCITPDLLLSTILLFYFYLLFDKDFELKPLSGLGCGLMGVLGYLCKSFGFFFFIIHFSLVCVVKFFIRKDPISRKKILKQYVMCMILFCVFASCRYKYKI